MSGERSAGRRVLVAARQELDAVNGVSNDLQVCESFNCGAAGVGPVASAERADRAAVTVLTLQPRPSASLVGHGPGLPAAGAEGADPSTGRQVSGQQVDPGTIHPVTVDQHQRPTARGARALRFQLSTSTCPPDLS